MEKIETCAWCGEIIGRWDYYADEGCDICRCKPLCENCHKFDDINKKDLCPLCYEEECVPF